MMMEPPSNPSPGVKWTGRTDRGRVRTNNEDAFLCLRFDAREVQYLGKYGEASTARADLLFAVCDGLGGARAGEFASRVAVDKITRLLPKSFKQSASGLTAGVGDVLAELFDEIHKVLTDLAAGDPDCAGMGTTLSLAWFTPGQMTFAHIGDSRIYYFPAAGGMKQLTQDDTHVGWLFRNGKINEREARSHPGRVSLQKALGAGYQFVTPQVGRVAVEPGDVFVLCTDGVVDGLFDSQIEELIRSPESGSPDAAEQIIRASLAQSGRDNTTVIVAEALREGTVES
jgi:PPM family protein phosphatase